MIEVSVKDLGLETIGIGVERLAASGSIEDDGPSSAALSAAGPIVIIESSRRRIPIDFRDLWEHRDLLYFLTWRDIKLRYKQTALGASWAILQPFLSMVVFTLLFGKLARVPSDGLPYTIFVYAGLLPWTFFNTAVSSSANSLVGNSALVTKVYFPRLVIPGAAVCAGMVDFTIAAMLLAIMMFYYQVGLTWNLLMVPELVALTAVFTLAVGFWMSALNVKYRDIRYALPFGLQLWLYLTPVIYPVNFIPVRFRWTLSLNPLSGIIEGYRSALFGLPFDWFGLGFATFLTLAAFLWSVYAFRQMEREFSDII
jgi:lipopolysaccharide transport system permease protein